MGRPRPGSSSVCSQRKPPARSYRAHWSHGFDRACPRDTWRARQADCPVRPPYDEEGPADASASVAAASNPATPACIRYGSRRPGKSWPSDADAIPERLMVRQDEVELALAGADDDGARRFPSIERDGLPGDRVATGCNCESRALAKTGAAPAVRNRPAQTAARIRLRRMTSP